MFRFLDFLNIYKKNQVAPFKNENDKNEKQTKNEEKKDITSDLQKDNYNKFISIDKCASFV